MSDLTQLSFSVGKLRALVNEARGIYARYIDPTENKISDKQLKDPNKNIVTDSLKSLIEKIASINKVLGEHENLVSNFALQDYENLTEKVLEKFSSKFIETTQSDLNAILSKSETNPPKIKKVIAANDQKLILGVNEADIENSQTTQKKSFSAALKDNLNNKLKNIPVTSTTVTRQGKAILTFPSAEVCLQAKSSLQTDFQVSVSDKKAPIVQPRLKINHLVPELTSLDKNELRTKIISKNDVLKNANESEFDVTFIEKNYNYAVAKVSPEIFQTLEKKGRIFIDLRSYPLSQHFHIIQCFKCQSFGHTSNSQVCNATDMTCLYCGRNHKSSDCTNKKNKEAHKCQNCFKSMNPKIKAKSNTHSATSKSCPVYLREIEKLKEITCYDQNAYLSSKNH